MNYFEYAVGLARAHAQLLQSGMRDDPHRVAPPEYDPERPDFESLPFGQRLDAADVACRRDLYRRALIESLPESDDYEGWLGKLLNSAVSDAEIGRRAREIVVAYLQRVALKHAEDLRDFT